MGIRRWRQYVRMGGLLCAFFVGGVYIGHFEHVIEHLRRAVVVGTAAAREFDRTRRNESLSFFGDAFELIRDLYVDPVPDEKLIDLAIDGMLTGLDPHSRYLDAGDFRELQDESRGFFVGVGIEVVPDDGVLRVVGAMDGTPALKAGIKAGDIITKLDGYPVRGLLVDTVMNRMRGPPGSKLTLTIERKGMAHEFEIGLRRRTIPIQMAHSRLESSNIGYVQLSEFTEQTEAKLRVAVKSLGRQAGGRLRALILDLRGNPGGLLDQAIAVARDFVPEGKIVATIARDTKDARWFAAAGTDITKGVPLVVLIDGDTASAAEAVAGALQDHRRAVLVGTRTFGKGTVQTIIPLPSGAAIQITTGRYYTPSGRSIQALGIDPDVLVEKISGAANTFGSEQEADLNHAFHSDSLGPAPNSEPRADLPVIIRSIPTKPPENFGAYDGARPEETDYQLQQALVVAKAMAIAGSEN